MQVFATRLRSLFETLGLTYMKLGQYLAARLDLIPEEAAHELSRLFERAPPVKFEDIRTAVETELGLRLEEVFSKFNREPIAAASVAQVHEAVTLQGNRVAVKIQRPGIDRIFAADMRNLRRLTTIIDALGMLGTVSMRELLDEFARWTKRELDFTTEGRTADRLRRESLPGGTVPLVYWNLTTRRVLTMEFVEGFSLGRIIELMNQDRMDVIEQMYPNLDIREVAKNFSFVIFHQLFITGFFHGDPHPGNIFVHSDNTVVFLDCGIFGELTEQQREYLAAHIENEALGNIDASFRYYAKQLIPTEETDLGAFERDAKAVLRLWYVRAMSPHAKPEDRHLGQYAGEMLKVVRKHHLRLSTDTLLFWRAMEALDATALRFSKYFDLIPTMQEFFEGIRPSPAQRLWKIAADRKLWLSVSQLALSAPTSAKTILSYFYATTPLPLRERESLEMRRTRNRRTKLMVSPIFALAATLLLVRVPLPVSVQIVLALIGVSVLAAVTRLMK